ncbi:MAG: hypothetical protein Q9162_005728 [Coniocarpon cinnabarinum]
MDDEASIKQEIALHPPAIQVNEPPKFDLETHISNYDPPTRLDRLTHIGLTSLPLSHDALRAAQASAKSSRNIPRYFALSSYLTNHYPNDLTVQPDEAWIAQSTAQTNAETSRLESELKGYKNNLIKESIRMAQEELGTHQFATGNLAEAGRAYGKMREFCTTQAHLAYMHLRMALVAVAQQNWMNVQVFVSRVLAQPTFGDYNKIAPALKPLLGLAYLSNADFATAAAHFIATDPAFTTMESVGNGIQLNRAVLSPNDVATYGALCALATLNRGEIQSQVLESSAPFRQFLELEPHMRRALTAFASGKYTQCLSTLSAYRADWLCDVYLHRHVENLITLIRRKCIVEYFKPFSAVTIQSMAEAFGDGNEQSMQEELIGLITSNTLQARIDAPAGLLLKPATTSERIRIAEKAIKSADEQERALRLRLWRVEMLSCGLEVKGGRGGYGGMDGMEEEEEAEGTRRRKG